MGDDSAPHCVILKEWRVTHWTNELFLRAPWELHRFPCSQILHQGPCCFLEGYWEQWQTRDLMLPAKAVAPLLHKSSPVRYRCQAGDGLWWTTARQHRAVSGVPWRAQVPGRRVKRNKKSELRGLIAALMRCEYELLALRSARPAVCSWCLLTGQCSLPNEAVC